MSWTANISATMTSRLALLAELRVLFYVGLFNKAHPKHFERCCISANRLYDRRSAFVVKDWMMDSGAFTEISTHGHYRHDVKRYAAEIRRWHGNGNLQCAVSQDYMCEPHILAITGLDVASHQRLTVERYDALSDCDLPVHLMPVLQGFDPTEYVRHLEAYGDRLRPGMWVGVGSVCKRNSNPGAIVAVLNGIAKLRPDLRLHGFGIKKTALRDHRVRRMLYSADSMAWSFAARSWGGQNDWEEAKAFQEEIDDLNDWVPFYGQ